MTDNNMDFKTDLTLSLSSDGVQFFKSSILAVWPVMAYLDGLPPYLQKQTIMILAVMAVRGDGKSFQLNLMIDDVLKQFERLNQQPLKWMFRGNVMRSRVLVSRVIADTPARSAMQGINSFSAAFGSQYCHHNEMNENQMKIFK